MNPFIYYKQLNAVKFLVLGVLLFATIHIGNAQEISTARDRVKTDVKIDMTYLGSVQYRNANEIDGSNWLIGCETLDRDFADYEEYKTYLNPLGIKLLRMQGGWNKTEKVKGQYDWAWLDKIIDDAVSRGLKPWLQTSYGNTNYPGGGGTNLGAGMPLSAEALDGYNKWVAAMVTRYKDKVKDWEIWNEPNFADNPINTPEITADFNIRTAEIIKKIQPDARISGLALGHFNEEFVEKFFKYIANKKKMHLFDNMTYHDYVYNPDSNYKEVEKIKSLLAKYGPNVKLRQGENGAPSAGGSGRGALWDYDWTELSQAKWDIRRMLGNLGHDVECSIFGIIEMAYTNGPINKLNYKGIIKSNESKKVLGPKMAYYAMQNVTSIFDNSLSRIKGLHHINDLKSTGPTENRYTRITDRSMSVFGYENKVTKKQVYTIWMDETIPLNTNTLKMENFTFTNANFDSPVYVDLLTGSIYEIPAANWSKVGNTYTFKNIPVYDSPILIADKSLLKFNQMTNKSKVFIIDAETPWEDLGGGVERQVGGYNDDLMIVKFRFKKGAVGAPHKHFQTQVAIVQSGVFELTINGEKRILKAGDGYYVDPNVVHGAVCLEEGILIDAFNPYRPEFLIKK